MGLYHDDHVGGSDPAVGHVHHPCWTLRQVNGFLSSSFQQTEDEYLLIRKLATVKSSRNQWSPSCYQYSRSSTRSTLLDSPNAFPGKEIIIDTQWWPNPILEITFTLGKTRSGPDREANLGCLCNFQLILKHCCFSFSVTEPASSYNFQKTVPIFFNIHPVQFLRKYSLITGRINFFFCVPLDASWVHFYEEVLVDNPPPFPLTHSASPLLNSSCKPSFGLLMQALFWPLMLCTADRHPIAFLTLVTIPDQA